MLTALLWALLVALPGQMPHPCDTLFPANATIDGNQVVMGFCHSQLNDQGNRDTGLQFQLSLDGVRIGQYATLTPITPTPNSLGSYLFQFPAWRYHESDAASSVPVVVPIGRTIGLDARRV